MNLTIEQMRKIVDGAPEGATEYRKLSCTTRYVRVGEKFAEWWDGEKWCRFTAPFTDENNLLRCKPLKDLIAAIADHDRTDHCSDIKNHISPNTKVIGMSDFERWFEDQDFYTNMRFIHGDKLFDKDGDIYRVLPVQMTYQGWSSQRQRSKDEFIAITQEWHKKGYEAGQKDLREACFHFETSMFHKGTAQCFKCGAMVDRDRNIID